MTSSAPAVALLGTLDTKAAEYDFVRGLLHRSSLKTVMVDTGVLGSALTDFDISRGEVAAAAGADLATLRNDQDRGRAVQAMADGAEAVVGRLFGEGRCDAGLALGGTGGTSIAAQAFRALPFGTPKIIVSTAASGDTSGYIGETDLVLMPSVLDIAGVNRLSARVLANAVGAVTGMLRMTRPDDFHSSRPLIAASMFGVTTPCLTTAREVLSEQGLEILVFHMTGVGGRSMESLIAGGDIAGVLDVTTTELADELVGGTFSAGPDRLLAAGRAGIPQVVSVGALDMVNFGPRSTVPTRFEERNLFIHNANVTLMRTTPAECAELGSRLVHRLSRSSGPVTLFLPLKGISAISTEGGPFHDPEADHELFSAVRAAVAGTEIELVERNTDINDPIFATEMAERLRTHLGATTPIGQDR